MSVPVPIEGGVPRLSGAGIRVPAAKPSDVHASAAGLREHILGKHERRRYGWPPAKKGSRMPRSKQDSSFDIDLDAHQQLRIHRVSSRITERDHRPYNTHVSS